MYQLDSLFYQKDNGVENRSIILIIYCANIQKIHLLLHPESKKSIPYLLTSCQIKFFTKISILFIIYFMQEIY